MFVKLRWCHVGILCCMSMSIYLYWTIRGPKAATEVPKYRSSISLFVRMTSHLKHRARFHCCLFKTLVMFWPSYRGKIVVVLDEESEQENDAFLGEIKHELKQFPDYNIDVKYEPLPKSSNVLNFPGSPKSPGYNRQLWSSFLMDMYTEDPIIAWMDNDAAFVAPVTDSTIFKDGRLRAFGEASCKYKWSWVGSWGKTVELALGLPMLADFMIYFPVYVHRDTITGCREFILKRFKTSNFEEAFKKFYHTGTGFVSPVSVILSYAWYYEKSRYDWNIKVNCDLEIYNRRFPSQHRIQPEHKDIFSAPQTAYHSNGKYFPPAESHHPWSFLRHTSFCLVQTALGYGLQETCQQFNVTSGLTGMLMLFNHDSHGHVERLKPGQTLCVGKLESYCFDVLKSYIQEFADELRAEKRKWDWKNLQVVGEVAKRFNITCLPNMP